jgi:hypothetical protein
MTHSRLRLFLATVLSFAAFALFAQDIRMGSLEGNTQLFASSPATLIDWSSPARFSGAVTGASVAWTGATSPCDNIFYVRFFAIPSNSFSLVMIAERGPFRAVNGINTVALEPPVNVTPETYIAIRRAAGPESCGMPFGTFSRDPGRALYSGDDFKSGAFTSLNPLPNFRLQAIATSAPSVRVSTLPVVGSVAGGFGSFFRTALTLVNPSPFQINGKLVFRAAGRAGSDSDPSLAYTIPPNGTVTYDDIIASMGQSGVGSLDVLATNSGAPIASARVFNDSGASGTNGLTEDAVPAKSSPQSTAEVLIPIDLTNFRLNVGVRTFPAATLTIDVYDAAGNRVATTSKPYLANYFEQVPAASLTGGPLPPGGRIVVSAFDKEFIVYGSVTDNRTNDPNMRIGSD